MPCTIEEVHGGAQHSWQPATGIAMLCSPQRPHLRFGIRDAAVNYMPPIVYSLVMERNDLVVKVYRRM